MEGHPVLASFALAALAGILTVVVHAVMPVTWLIAVLIAVLLMAGICVVVVVSD